LILSAIAEKKIRVFIIYITLQIAELFKNLLVISPTKQLVKGPINLLVLSTTVINHLAS